MQFLTDLVHIIFSFLHEATTLPLQSTEPIISDEEDLHLTAPSIYHLQISFCLLPAGLACLPTIPLNSELWCYNHKEYSSVNNNQTAARKEVTQSPLNLGIFRWWPCILRFVIWWNLFSNSHGAPTVTQYYYITLCYLLRATNFHWLNSCPRSNLFPSTINCYTGRY